MVLYCPLQLLIPTAQRSQTVSSLSPNRNCVEHAHARSLPPNVIKLPLDESSSDSKTEVRLLIVTYMRSGSTFVGSMFDRNPSAMYVCEPLNVVLTMFPLRQETGLVSLDGEYSISETELREKVLTGFLNCSFKDMYFPALTDYSSLLGTKTKVFLQCLARVPGILGLHLCLPQLQRFCQDARTVVVKTAHYSMQEAFSLMHRDPKLKVIHLLRDPRGALLSQQLADHTNASSMIPHSRVHCEKVQEDILAGDEMSERYPDRVIRVRYEDIALYPLPYITHLLAFSGLNVSSDLEHYLEEITGSRRSEERALGDLEVVEETNSSAMAFAWRDRHDFDDTSGIDSQCGSLYKLTGYLPLDSEHQLKDRRVPSMLTVLEIPRFLRLP
ncbi:carbohydrate sulfotransferase 5-like [Babylonia areolata]|uniref:carbohydrate sulfotransferase 5-like n=1 Tax=Babylonia areolata TaxID=304850 RepID=UPI003FD17A1D